jgi:uncharacterized iron-regulated protein
VSIRPVVAPVILALAVGLGAGPPAAAGASTECVPAGRWLETARRRPVEGDKLLATMARRPVVLLGELHTAADHHRWQLHVLAALHALNPNLVMAFEAFPRRVQPILDRWVRGEMNERHFLERVDWNEIWRYDPAHYLPLFHFARLHRLPMVAMNVDISLIQRVRRDGWAAVPAAERHGIGDPAPPSEAYIESLAEVFGRHGPEREPHEGRSQDEIKPVDRNDPNFRRFVETQTVWDRAMAEAIAKARKGGGDPLVVAFAGRGHLEYGHGIPRQLAALGIGEAAVLLPWEADSDCARLEAGDGRPVADALFGLPPAAEEEVPKRLTLGVFIEATDGGVVVRRVMPDSVAEKEGLAAGDVIAMAAGRPLAKPRDLVEIMGRQGPGTWLPMTVRRGEQTLEIVAKFPPAP